MLSDHEDIEDDAPLSLAELRARTKVDDAATSQRLSPSKAPAVRPLYISVAHPIDTDCQEECFDHESVTEEAMIAPSMPPPLSPGHGCLVLSMWLMLFGLC